MSRRWDWQYDRFVATYRTRFRLLDDTLVEITIDVENLVAVRFNRFEIVQYTVSEEPVVLLNVGVHPNGEASDGETDCPTTQPDAAPAEPAAGASAGPAEETVPADIAGMARDVRQRTG